MVLTPLMLLTAKSELFQIKLHQVLEILLELLLRKIREKLRLGALVDFADAVNQLPFTHTTHPFHKTNYLPFNLRNIDPQYTFSLAERVGAKTTPHNQNHYIAERRPPSPPYMAQPNMASANRRVLSNKTPRHAEPLAPKKI
jgi:hypothetical protein